MRLYTFGRPAEALVVKALLLFVFEVTMIKLLSVSVGYPCRFALLQAVQVVDALSYADLSISLAPCPTSLVPHAFHQGTDGDRSDRR